MKIYGYDIKVEQDGCGFMAEIPDFYLCGYGISAQEAIEMVKNELGYFISKYQDEGFEF